MVMRRKNEETQSVSGDAFSVSISDLMAGLMSIFILTICYFILNFSQVTSQLTQNDIKRAELLDALHEELEQNGIKVTVDEEHGILDLEYIKEKCDSIFSEYPVRYCVLFGSYAKGKAVGTSDVDLLVSSDVKGLKFYGMVEKLRTSLHKRVDVLSLEQLKDNLELTDEILKDGIRIYG